MPNSVHGLRTVIIFTIIAVIVSVTLSSLINEYNRDRSRHELLNTITSQHNQLGQIILASQSAKADQRHGEHEQLFNETDILNQKLDQLLNASR